MTYAQRTFCLGLLLLSCVSLAAAQEIRLLPGESLPVLEGVQIRANVRIEETGIYRYSYTVTNPRSNTGEIWSIGIEITKPPMGQDVGSEGVISGPRFAKHSSALVLTEIGIPLIPVGLYAPLDWISGLSIAGYTIWGGADDPYKLSPGRSMGGFEITSRGLPGIRTVRVVPKFFQTPVDEATEDDVDRITTIENFLVRTYQTLGPTAPPATFVALDFVTYLEGLKHQAQTLGWITNEGIVKSLDVKLDQVRKHLQAGYTKTAGNVLQAFMNEVSAQGCSTYDACPQGKHLTPEASRLLYFNAKYLLDHL